MTSIKLSSNTTISIKNFLKRVMRPATGNTENSIIQNYDSHDLVRIKHSYGKLQGGEIIEAVNRYQGKINRNVAEEKINEFAEEQARLKAKKLGVELETRGKIPTKLRGEKKRQEIAKMRAELKKAQIEKIKKEKEEAVKKRKNILRTQESVIEDMSID